MSYPSVYHRSLNQPAFSDHPRAMVTKIDDSYEIRRWFDENLDDGSNITVPSLNY